MDGKEFFFDSNSWNGWIRSKEDWSAAVAAIAKTKGISEREASVFMYESKRDTIRDERSLPSFGYRMEHRGGTLSEWLEGV